MVVTASAQPTIERLAKDSNVTKHKESGALTLVSPRTSLRNPKSKPSTVLSQGCGI